MGGLAILALAFGGLALAMVSGMPVAFALIAIDIVGLYLHLGTPAWSVLADSAFGGIAQFTLVPIPLFLLMGEFLVRSGFGAQIVGLVDDWMGRVPGRLAISSVSAGAVFGAVSGSSMASAALLGSSLLPEMEKRGYRNTISVGAILGAGGLAILIPPSGLGVLLGALAKVSISELLIACIIPGLILALLYGAYFIIRAWLQPHLAPPYQGEKLALTIRLRRLATLIPLALLILLVTGFIFLGIATPSESAALGAVGAFVVSWAHGRMDWRILRQSLLGTLSTTAMIMLILVGATTFSQLLSMTGAAPALVETVTQWRLGPIGTTLLIQAAILILGCFIDAISIMLITVPVFMPLAAALGIDPIWLCVLMLIQLELGGITPPFGVLLFVMKGVRPNLSTLTIYDAVWPIVVLQLLLCFLVMFTPSLTGWLPALMIR